MRPAAAVLASAVALQPAVMLYPLFRWSSKGPVQAWVEAAASVSGPVRSGGCGSQYPLT